MGTIQTKYRDDRGEWVELTPNDAKYWEGPHVYVPFPKLLFRQSQPGQTNEQQDKLIVQSQDEWERAGQAWKETPDEARAYFAALEAEMAKAAAEANYAASKMSQKAHDEFTAHARSTDEMTTDVPAPKKRGRPKRAVVPEGA